MEVCITAIARVVKVYLRIPREIRFVSPNHLIQEVRIFVHLDQHPDFFNSPASFVDRVLPTVDAAGCGKIRGLRTSVSMPSISTLQSPHLNHARLHENRKQ